MTAVDGERPARYLQPRLWRTPDFSLFGDLKSATGHFHNFPMADLVRQMVILLGEAHGLHDRSHSATKRFAMKRMVASTDGSRIDFDQNCK